MIGTRETQWNLYIDGDLLCREVVVTPPAYPKVVEINMGFAPISYSGSIKLSKLQYWRLRKLCLTGKMPRKKKKKLTGTKSLRKGKLI